MINKSEQIRLIAIKTIIALGIMISNNIDLYAQDIIVLHSGDEISARIIEISLEDVSYKKLENLDGPVYKIPKTVVSSIHYENGTTDSFNLSKSYRSRTDVQFVDDEKYSKYLVEHKSKKVLYDYQIDIQQVLSTSRIYYYGIDMISLILCNPDKVGLEAGNEKYITAWVAHMNNEIPPDIYLKRWLRKDDLVLRQDIIHAQNANKSGKWIESSTQELPIGFIQSLVKIHLTKIDEKEGVGFIIIMDSFNKRKEAVNGIFCFFDINSGDLLWVSRTKGEADGAGMTKHWAFGMINSLKAFIDRVYKPEIK